MNTAQTMGEQMEERSFHTGGVTGSIPVAPTIQTHTNTGFAPSDKGVNAGSAEPSTTPADRYGAGVDGAGVRHTPGQLDAVVLSVLRERGRLPTYVIANVIGSSSGWRRPDTASVLRSCRRLQDRGLVDEVPGHYAVMKTWTALSKATPQGGSNEAV